MAPAQPPLACMGNSIFVERCRCNAEDRRLRRWRGLSGSQLGRPVRWHDECVASLHISGYWKHDSYTNLIYKDGDGLVSAAAVLVRRCHSTEEDEDDANGGCHSRVTSAATRPPGRAVLGSRSLICVFNGGGSASRDGETGAQRPRCRAALGRETEERRR